LGERPSAALESIVKTIVIPVVVTVPDVEEAVSQCGRFVIE
jgi:hypothetical protein